MKTVEMRRVVITGVGAVTPVGNTAEEFWAALIQGKSGIGPITRFDATPLPTKIAGELKGFDPLRYMDKKDDRKLDPFLKYAIACAAMAVEDAGLNVERVDRTRFGVLVGSGIGGISTLLETHKILLEKGPDRVSPFFIPMLIVNMASGLISMRFGAKGPNSSVVTACATGNHAIGDAMRIIQRNDADVMICGGAEACITPMGIGGFAAMRALSQRNDEPEKASRPWDTQRDGFVVGEGSGILVLEEFEHAKRRGANILAEIAGYGMSADAYHITSPSDDGDGAFRVMRQAIRDAGIEPEQIDYVNAHGTSTEVGDRIETTALKRVFCDHAYKLAVSSTKSMTGHLLGGAGGLEAGITVLALRDQIAPPTVNLDLPDPECDLDYVPHKARPMKIEYALSNSFGFGGTNGCLIFKRYTG